MSSASLKAFLKISEILRATLWIKIRSFKLCVNGTKIYFINHPLTRHNNEQKLLVGFTLSNNIILS